MSGRYELLNSLGLKIRKGIFQKYSKKYSKEYSNKKTKKYVYSIFFLSIFFTVLFCVSFYYNSKSVISSAIFGFLILIPISEIVVLFTNYLLTKTSKPKILPKLDFSKNLPEEYSTFVVMPTILDSKEKIKEMVQKMEVYFLANKEDNIYFALLGDCTMSKNKVEKIDDEIINTSLEEIKKLNNKYRKSINKFPRFHFLYRQRTWNAKEECYLGWERKRGLLYQFNEYLINKTNEFYINTINDMQENIPKIKYVITLDQDTNLILGSGLELIGAMAHVLNRPVLNKNKDNVLFGHAIIQPRVGINLEKSRKTIFTKLYANMGGIDLYTNAISDIYEDNFDEGIFTGKGIYDLEVFQKVLKNEIPENTVLSHDLLEGNYLRCGLASDILVLDDYPKNYISYCLRQSRWIRGDFQIARWLKKKIKVRNYISKQNPLRYFV